MLVFISAIVALMLVLSIIGIFSPFVAVVVGSAIVGIFAIWITLGALVCLSKGDAPLFKWIPQAVWLITIICALMVVSAFAHDAKPGLLSTAPYIGALSVVALVWTLLMNAVERYNLLAVNVSRQAQAQPPQTGFA